MFTENAAQYSPRDTPQAVATYDTLFHGSDSTAPPCSARVTDTLHQPVPWQSVIHYTVLFRDNQRHTTLLPR